MNNLQLALCIATLTLCSAACDERRFVDPRSPSATRAPRLEPPPTFTADARSIAAAHPSSPVNDAPDALLAGHTRLVHDSHESTTPDPLALEHRDGRLVDHLARVNVLRARDDLAGALLEARRALFDDPTDDALLRIIDGLAFLGSDHAIRVLALEQLARTQLADASPLVEEARVLITLRQLDRALEVAHAALKRAPDDPEIYHVMGRVHLSRGELSPAIAMFEKVLSLEPDHGHALNNLGYAYLRANHNEEAVDVLARASDLLPHLSYVFNNLGVALERTGRISEAKAAYAQASFLAPRYVKAKLNSARVAALSPPPTSDARTPQPPALDTTTLLNAHNGLPSSADASDPLLGADGTHPGLLDPTGHTGALSTAPPGAFASPTDLE